MRGAGHDRLIPARPSRRFSSGFGFYVRRLIRRRFHALRVASSDGLDTAGLDETTTPLIVLLNHSSWWDPLVAFHLAREFLPNRPTLAPMDRDQLERFGFFRRIGVFGIDPDDPESLDAMRDYVLDELKRDPSSSIWLTPQGRFTDVREPIRIRPGAASIASALGSVRCVSVAIEYVFWQESRPEALIRMHDVEQPEQATTAGWQRAMTSAMQTNADALETLSRERDPERFESIVGDRARTSPVYDLMLKLRGRSGEIAARRDTDKDAARA